MFCAFFGYAFFKAIEGVSKGAPGFRVFSETMAGSSENER